MGSSCDSMTEVLTAVLDFERGMRGIGICICAGCAGLVRVAIPLGVPLQSMRGVF